MNTSRLLALVLIFLLFTCAIVIYVLNDELANMRTVRVVMAQILVETSDVQGNIERILNAISEASMLNADFVVLPETSDVGWLSDHTRELAQPIPGEVTRILCEKAKEHAMYIVCGLAEKSSGKVYNSAVLIDRDGNILLKHRKINVFAKYYLDLDTYELGTETGIAETEFGKVSVAICADNFPETHWIAEEIAEKGARIIFSPSAWAIPPDQDPEDVGNNKFWIDSYKTLCQKLGIYIFGVNHVGVISEGVWKNHPVYGGSVAVSPSGRVIAEAKFAKPDIVVVEITVRN